MRQRKILEIGRKISWLRIPADIRLYLRYAITDCVPWGKYLIFLIQQQR